MADQIKATPRNSLAALLSDAINSGVGYMKSPQRTQQLQGLGRLIESTQIPYVAENLSYDPSGRNLFTGGGGLGGTTRMRPEAIEGLMNIAPVVGAANRGLMQATKGLPVGMSMEAVGGMKFLRPTAAPQEKALRLAQERAALPVEQGGLGLPVGNTAEQRANAMGAIDYLHGTERLDRFLEGKNINPKRATSGPMPFGTDSGALASNYAMNKADTSRIANDMGDMQNYFQVFPKSMGERGTSPYSVEQLWYRLPQEKKAEILEKSKRVGFENFDESSGPLTLHPKGVNAMNVGEDTWNYFLNKESKGNPLTALRKLWGESGNLYGNEDKLAEVYKLAGFPYEISQTNAPWTSAKGVMTGKAMISNPLDTSNVSELQETVIPFLKEQFKNDRTRTKAYGADQWDKNTRYTPKEWVANLEKDIAAGENSFVWTSIPDKITNSLKEIGYNGILDKSGKGGGNISDVVIPFSPDQVRSRFAAFDPLRRTAAIAAASGLAAPDLLANQAPASPFYSDPFGNTIADTTR